MSERNAAVRLATKKAENVATKKATAAARKAARMKAMATNSRSAKETAKVTSTATVKVAGFNLKVKAKVTVVATVRLGTDKRIVKAKNGSQKQVPNRTIKSVTSRVVSVTSELIGKDKNRIDPVHPTVKVKVKV